MLKKTKTDVEEQVITDKNNYSDTAPINSLSGDVRLKENIKGRKLTMVSIYTMELQG